MESSEEVRILILGNDPGASEFLNSTLSAWGMKSQIINNYKQVANHLKQNYYHVVLLDIDLSKKRGTALTSKISELCPDSKVILLTDHADPLIAVAAIRAGAFDFVQKPIQVELLSHSINRALNTQRIESDYKKACEELESSKRDLLAHRGRLNYVERQLIETLQTIEVLARNQEREKEEIKKNIALKTKFLASYILKRFQQEEDLKKYKAESVTIISYLEDLASGLVADVRLIETLSPSELRVATLIIQGLTTDTIAGNLGISLGTVRTHRKNIRRKLRINDRNFNLRNYLAATLRKNSTMAKK